MRRLEGETEDGGQRTEVRGRRAEDGGRRTPRLNTLEGNPVQLGKEDGGRRTEDRKRKIRR